jgi:hypothetical protein
MAYRDFKLGEPKPPNCLNLLTTASHFGNKDSYFGTVLLWEVKYKISKTPGIPSG